MKFLSSFIKFYTVHVILSRSYYHCEVDQVYNFQLLVCFMGLVLSGVIGRKQ